MADISEVAAQFIREGHKPGEVVPLSWFYNAFDLEKPHDKMPYKEAKRIELKKATLMEELYRTLLEEYNILLKSVPAQGYLWVLPGEQADTAAVDMMKTLGKYARRGELEARHVN